MYVLIEKYEKNIYADSLFKKEMWSQEKNSEWIFPSLILVWKNEADN